jgi:simple sugar transport system permease protein
MIWRVAGSAAAAAAGLAAGAVAILLSGGSPVAAYSALADGALGSTHGWSEVAVKSCPLIITGLGVALAFRAGIWNIGAEGQLVAGALAAVWLGTQPLPVGATLGLPLALAAGAAGGGLLAAVAAVLKSRRNVDEVISTIMLNFIVLGLVGYLVQGPLMEAAGRYPQSDAVLDFARMPRPIPGMRVHLGLIAAILLVPVSFYFLFATRFGFVVRAAGANPLATRIAGLPAERATFTAFVASGALAGLAGGIEVTAITHRMYESFSPGYGYTAIAVALLGRLHPAGVLAAALLFGILEAGSGSMQRVAGVSAGLVALIQAGVIFALAAIDYRSRGTT